MPLYHDNNAVIVLTMNPLIIFLHCPNTTKFNSWSTENPCLWITLDFKYALYAQWAVSQTTKALYKN